MTLQAERTFSRWLAAIKESPFGTACLLLSLLPIAFAVWFVQGFSLIMPMIDHWAMLDLFSAWASGELRPKYFLSPHNGWHFGLFARVIMAALAVITGWSLRAEIYLGLCFAVFTAFILHRAFKESDAVGRETRWAITLFTVALLFSPAQDFLWTCGVGLFHYFESACVATAVWALARRRPSLGIAIASAVAATGSRFEGIFIWVVLFPAVLAAATRLERPRRAALLWVAAGALSWVIVLGLIALKGMFGTSQLGHVGFGPRLKMALSILGTSAGLFTQYDSEPLRSAFWPAGVAALAVFAWASARLLLASSELRSKALPWIGLGAFGLAFAAVAGGARHQEVELRVLFIYLAAYSTQGSLVAIAALHVAALALAEYRPPFGLSAVLVRRSAVALGLLVVMLNYVHAFPRLSAWRSDGHWDRYCVELADYLTPENSCFKFPDRWPKLKRSGFAKSAQDLRFDEASPFGRIEGVAPGVEPMTGSPVAVISGWAALPDEDAGTVLLAFGDSRRFQTPATQLSPGASGVHFIVRVSWSVGERDPRPLRAWAYDKRAGSFRPLEGEARVKRMEGR